jgi:very-short-patch-repair endonuclease
MPRSIRPHNLRRLTLKRHVAHDLRLNPTDLERLLWRHLRSKRMGGFRFRRQQPIGPYVVDFYCASAKLIVELDGGHHGEAEQLAHDLARTGWLESRDYKVVRIWNGDVLNHPEAVLDFICKEVEAMRRYLSAKA